MKTARRALSHALVPWSGWAHVAVVRRIAGVEFVPTSRARVVLHTYVGRIDGKLVRVRPHRALSQAHERVTHVRHNTCGTTSVFVADRQADRLALAGSWRKEWMPHVFEPRTETFRVKQVSTRQTAVGVVDFKTALTHCTWLSGALLRRNTNQQSESGLKCWDL